MMPLRSLRYLHVALWYGFIGLTFTIGISSVAASPALVILLRHAEKPEDESNPHLSAQGYDRAKALVGFFATNAVIITNPPVAALFAARPASANGSVRCQETLSPLMQHLKLPVSAAYRAEDFKPLARHLLESTNYSGKTVVVCWPRTELIGLAKALGAVPKPKTWKSEVYDRVWLLRFGGAKGVVDCQTVQQNFPPPESPRAGS
jgi:hypothetical protein